MNEFFRLVPEHALSDLDLSDEERFSYMVEREKLSSTVLSHSVAVPHIVQHPEFERLRHCMPEQA